jgi:lipopolysaccharide/colanic/teichoic acid biosynthesis glycosyltransferase
MFDFDDIDREDIKKIILIVILIFFSIVGLFLIFPILLYIIVFLGIVIPSYILYKNYKKDKYEK